MIVFVKGPTPANCWCLPRGVRFIMGRRQNAPPGEVIHEGRCDMANYAKRMIVCLVLASMILPTLVGCGVGTTAEENNRTVQRVWDADARMLTDDLGLLVLARRPFHGSRVPLK